MLSSFKLLLQMALRNIFSSFLNIIIGLIVLGGTVFFVMGGSLLGSMDESMSRSIVGSVVGNAQVYQASSKDSPSVFEGWQPPELDPIPDFSKVKPVLMKHPNVKTVVPQGINTAIVVYGNSIDQVLEKLRNVYSGRPVRAGEAKLSGAALAAQKTSLKAHLKQMVENIQADFNKLNKVASKNAVDQDDVKNLAKAGSPAFWASFDGDALGHLEFLENKIAYLVPDSDQIFLQYVGTDLDAYQAAFDRFQLVDGQKVPKGQRGILISKYTYEEMFKLKNARRLDKIKDALDIKGKKIAKDPDLQDLVKQNTLQTREIALQLDAQGVQKAVAIMQKATGSQETDLAKLMGVFFATTDENFHARYDVFYKELAPMLELYRMRPGDMLTIKAYTKSGFVSAVNIKIYGTFNFKGLESSNLAGALSLMDLMSFRDLYGYVTPEKIAEAQALKKAAGAKSISREDAEADLFGGDAQVVSETTNKKIDDKAQLGGATAPRTDLGKQVYSQAEIEQGVAMEAAIVLKDPSKLKQTMAELQAMSDDAELGIKVIDWQKAAGNLGQFVTIAKLILLIATAIIFVVALVIINNAVVMATLQRRREFGTLRAIGAQKGFVLGLVLTETIVLGLVFGLVGAVLGSAFVLWLHKAGVPAGNEFLEFFFSGPRLYPDLSAGALIGAFVVVVIVACASALYPALMATRVSPVRAMASED
jgi:ABC-type lipoprotein release transport system permease subunit